jgi:hypothetical protein
MPGDGEGQVSGAQGFADRDARDAEDLPNAPGDLILLRAPGLMGADVRPFHGVTDIAEQRTTFALRQQSTGP